MNGIFFFYFSNGELKSGGFYGIIWGVYGFNYFGDKCLGFNG